MLQKVFFLPVPQAQVPVGPSDLRLNYHCWYLGFHHLTFVYHWTSWEMLGEGAKGKEWDKRISVNLSGVAIHSIRVELLQAPLQLSGGRILLKVSVSCYRLEQQLP